MALLRWAWRRGPGRARGARGLGSPRLRRCVSEKGLAPGGSSASRVVAREVALVRDARCIIPRALCPPSLRPGSTSRDEGGDPGPPGPSALRMAGTGREGPEPCQVAPSAPSPRPAPVPDGRGGGQCLGLSLGCFPHLSSASGTRDRAPRPSPAFDFAPAPRN